MIETAILLSTYNGEKYLSFQLDSILKQTYDRFVLYIRDDGSTDSTKDILLNYTEKNKNIILLDDDNRNIGASASFLWLLKNVEAKYYMFCDQDDIWLDNKIQLQIEQADISKSNQDKPLVVFHDLILTNSDGIVINKSFWDMHNIIIRKINFQNLFVKNIITGCSCLINQSMKIELLKFDSNKILMYDHIIALIAYGYGKAIVINTGLILYRDHSNSVTPKSRISLSYRIVNFIKNINEEKYLIPQIRQIEEFIKIHENFLIERFKRSAFLFISLRKKWPIFRFIYLKIFFTK